MPAPDTAPQLGPNSYDFNALHDALRAGKSAEEAHDAALIEETVMLTAEEAEARAAASVAEVPTLAGLKTEQLIERAVLENVLHAHDRDGNVVDFADAGSNGRMIEAIEASRAGSPILPAEAAPGADAAE